MAELSDLTDRSAVLDAIQEWDEIGRDAFLAKYRFGTANRYWVRHNGMLYDIKPLLAAAHGYQFPDKGPLTPEDRYGSGRRSTVPKARELGFEVEEDGNGTSVEGDPPAFIFQSNPKFYDIAAAVRELDEMNWSVAQSRNQIHAGARVYVWQSGPGGGVIAEGRILTDPEMLPEQEGRKFIRDPEKFAGEGLRVRLSIDRVLDEPLTRGELMAHPLLKDLTIIRFANATNYPVTPEQDAALLELMGGEDRSGRLGGLIEEWLDETGYPTEKDDERRNEREMLAAAISEDNLDQVIADPERFEILEFGKLAHFAYGGPGPQSAVHTHLHEGPQAKRQLAQAIRHLLYDGGEVDERLDDVLLRDEWRFSGFSEALATKALAVVYPDAWLPLYQHEGEKGKLNLMEAPQLRLTVPEGFEDWSPGRRIKWTNDQLRGVTEPLLPGDPWGQMVFLYWLRGRMEPMQRSVAALAEELMVETAWLEEVVDLLEEKRQVIFQGPPGTGKTYVARRLGKYFEELGGRTETVQFHPSYTYEDFVEGYRPTIIGTQPGFELVEGPLKRMAMKAEADPEHKYVLIIDELNRGNVAKVFGELYFLLEYRGERIRLQYAEKDSDDTGESSHFGLPRNLWIVATMNTADRSIALMDAALRRRFYFVDYYPDRPPVDGLLERWIDRNGLHQYEWVAEVVRRANAKLDDGEAAIGPSHFLLSDPARLDDERIERIWRHSVIPYLKERLMGEPERLEEFALEKLKENKREAPAIASEEEPSRQAGE